MADHAVPHYHRSTGPIRSFCRTVSLGVGDGDRSQQWTPSGYVEVDQPLLGESAREPEDERDPPYSGWKGRQCRGVRAYPRPSWRS
jgi:hypothetical protein